MPLAQRDDRQRQILLDHEQYLLDSRTRISRQQAKQLMRAAVHFRQRRQGGVQFGAPIGVPHDSKSPAPSPIAGDASQNLHGVFQQRRQRVGTELAREAEATDPAKALDEVLSPENGTWDGGTAPPGRIVGTDSLAATCNGRREAGPPLRGFSVRPPNPAACWPARESNRPADHRSTQNN